MVATRKRGRLESSATSCKPVEIAYADLKRGVDLSAAIETAFGVDGLGLLTVSGVPGLGAARDELLPLASAFAALPEDVKASCEMPDAYYAFGWSHGQEKLQGRPDLAKGSYYFNPLSNRPFDDPELIEKFPTFAAPNIWPEAAMPALEPACMGAGQLIHSVGCLIAEQCDRYVHSKCSTFAPTKLKDLLARSRCCKARLLHYFPLDGHDVATSSDALVDEEVALSSWCGWHNDHSLLTGLMPAAFFDHGDAGAEAEAPVRLTASPDPTAGLYVRDRRGKLVKPQCPPTHLCFQIGETAQVLTGGLLQATPHAVRGCAVAHVSRASFAVFMEPEWTYPMTVPDGVDPEATQTSTASSHLPKGVPPLRSRWGSTGCPFTMCNFGDFTDVTLAAYH